MARPQSRDELLAASEATFTKLSALISSLSPERLEAEFAFEDRDRNVRDVVVHVHEWHLLLIDWVEANLAGTALEGSALEGGALEGTALEGTARPFLPHGYTWTTYAPMNAAFRDAHQGTTLPEALALVGASRARVRALIEGRTDEELFTKKYFSWTGTTSLGAYCVSVTSSHDEWAMKKIRRHARS